MRYGSYMSQLNTTFNGDITQALDMNLAHIDIQVLVSKAIKPFRLLTHPFYLRWQSGQLKLEELAYYASQYRLFERYLPSFLIRLTAALPKGDARDLILANLADEEGDPIAHIDLFERFANAVDAPVSPTGPAMTNLITNHEKLLAQSPVAALAGFLAYETQTAEIAETKAEGLKQFYGISNFGASFWTHHSELEKNHAAWTTEALSMLIEDEYTVITSAEAIARSWWEFLDEQDSHLI